MDMDKGTDMGRGKGKGKDMGKPQEFDIRKEIGIDNHKGFHNPSFH